VATAIFFCVTTTHKLFVKYRDAPIIIKYGDASDALDNLPFPAITFNNELQLQREFDRMKLYVYFYRPTVDGIKKMTGGDR
jgi:hypothetical protein